MKTCPTCSETYKDDINFCLADGTTLLSKKKSGKEIARSRWNEVIPVFLGAIALLVFLSLVTSSPDDRSLISTGNGSPSNNNWVGVVGANIAAVFFSTFGWTAYLIPLLIVLIGWRVFQSDTLVPRASRVAGYVFFAISLSALIALFGGYGAMVGEAAAQGAEYFIGTIGASILYIAIFVSSLLLITNFTLAGIMSHLEVAWEGLRVRIDEKWAIRREARSGEISAALERAQKRRGKRDLTSETLPPTISVGEVERMAAAAAAAGRVSLPFAEDGLNSSARIDAGENPYETVKV